MKKLFLGLLCAIAFVSAAEGLATAAPYGIRVSQTCQANGTVSLTFDWQGSDPASPQMWIGASLYSDGWYWWRDWAIGPYTFYSALPAWHGFPQGVRHYVHIAELRSWGQWEWSAIVPVDVIRCPAPPPPPPPDKCHPSYPTVCIPYPPPDLDCPQIPHRRFTVLPPDPHRFDGDFDGVGCES